MHGLNVLQKGTWRVGRNEGPKSQTPCIFAGNYVYIGSKVPSDLKASGLWLSQRVQIAKSDY